MSTSVNDAHVFESFSEYLKFGLGSNKTGNHIMLILFVTSELEGLVKSGGVGDFSRALPLALKDLGHDVRIVLPYYRQIAETIEAPLCIGSLCVSMGNSDVYCAVRECHLKEIPTYLLEHHGFFDRPRLYDDGVWSYVDSADRYAFLSKAALRVCKSLSFRPHVVHSNDWQTSLIPFYLKIHELDDFFKETASVLTIHSAFLHGRFFSDKQCFIGVPAECFTSDIIEDYGSVNFMKAGIYYADKINAVSPGYAAELLTPEGAHGLHEYFRRREKDLRGILNGCDYSLWNPGTDPYIPVNFDIENLSGKVKCKTELQKDLGLEVDKNRPLFGMVCRLSNGKGFVYLIPAMREALKGDIQFLVLGSGEPSIERDLGQLVAEHPRKAAYRGGYDDQTAHCIYAGCDFFLMPSLFEACGFSVMYGMSYGTIPIVRAVGGLKDTVEDIHKSQSGTGFVFENPCTEELCICIQRAIHAYRDNPEDFLAIVHRAMQKRFEWHSSAQQYVKMYRDALEKRNESAR